MESNGSLQTLGKCLDVDAAGTANGTTVDLYDCNGTGAQVWQPQSDGALLNPASGKCLDDTGWSTTPGTQAQIWSCTGGGQPVLEAALTAIRKPAGPRLPATGRRGSWLLGQAPAG